MDKDDVRYLYLRDDKNRVILNHKNGTFKMYRGNPIACVASYVDFAKGEIHFGLSTVCTGLDRFDRNLARVMSLGRLVMSPKKIVPADRKVPECRFDILELIMMELTQRYDTPVSAAKAAKRWLDQRDMFYPEKHNHNNFSVIPAANPTVLVENKHSTVRTHLSLSKTSSSPVQFSEMANASDRRVPRFDRA